MPCGRSGLVARRTCAPPPPPLRAQVLLDLIQSKVSYVLQDTIVVIKVRRRARGGRA